MYFKNSNPVHCRYYQIIDCKCGWSFLWFTHVSDFILDTLFELKDTENALKAFKQGHNLTPSDPIITANTALLSCLMGLEDSGEFIQKFDTLCEEGQNITQEVSDHFRHAFQSNNSFK